MSESLQAPLPEFTVNASMRAAASSVAASFHAYQQSCFDMPNAKNTDEIRILLKSQRERKDAYHLAMKFLSAASLKANPAYDLAANKQLSPKQSAELSPLLEQYLETRLNQLIQSETEANPLICNTSDYHPVIAGPW